MAPKNKKRVSSATEPAIGDTNVSGPKRRRASPSSSKTSGSHSQSQEVQTFDIDYDKLAAAMLRQMAPSQRAALDPLAMDIHTVEEAVPTRQPALATAVLPTAVDQHPTCQTNPIGPNHLPLVGQNKDMNSGSPVMSLLENLFGSKGSSQTSTMAQQSSHGSTHQPTNALSAQALRLLSAATADRTKVSYLRSWQLLEQFLQPSSIKLPLPVDVVGNFVAHLFSNKYSPATIATHVSAISYVHKILGLEDMTHSFLIRKMLKGCQKMKGVSDSRLPITKDILYKIVNALNFVVSDPQIRLLLRTLFLLAFNAFMRLGELVCKSYSESDKVLQRSDVSIAESDEQGPAVNMVLRHFKNNTDHQPISLHLVAKDGALLYCPVRAVKQYLSVFSHTDGPFFQMANGLPVTYVFVTQRLTEVISFVGLDPTLFKGHSFRIGAATEAAKMGYSESVIQRMGRWNSNAVQRYIRINAFIL
ncbi:uncharacterized protein LOC110443160 isoform X3 [Mizuhopecten yessoensis]|nr:uncharacterized protein LOC110443160 isoform X3 [Mizuhopecten yessoensis]